MLTTNFILTVLLGLACCGEPQPTQTDASDRPPRTFQLNYGATVEGIPPGATVRVWFPIPQSSRLQAVEEIETVVPAPLQRFRDPEYGNAIGYFTTTHQALEPMVFRQNYRVTRHEAKPDAQKADLTVDQRELLLKENRLVPISGKPLELLERVTLADGTADQAKQLYEIVDNYMTYDKSQPGYGNGDVLWACSSRSGNCTDLHSLFISLARSLKIPANFEIGFPIATNQSSGAIAGYHCWAWFYTAETGWMPVDISEADKDPSMKQYYFGRLTPDRVAFSTGRDIALVPNNASGRLNYFVYPHIEVDGQVWPQTKIRNELTYADEPVASAGQTKQ